MVKCGAVLYGVAWCGMVWYGMVWTCREGAWTYLIAVVGRGEHGDALAVVLLHVSVVLDLVGTNHELQVVGGQERHRVVAAEAVAHAAL